MASGEMGNDKKAKGASQGEQALDALPLSIRPILPHDVEAATLCGLEAWQSTIRVCLEAFSHDQFIALQEAFRLYLCSFASGAVEAGERIIVAELDGAVLGFCGYDNHKGYLSDLWVSPVWQGKGVAQALMDEARSTMLDQGRRFLTLEVLAQNHRAFAFYKKQGFVETKRRVKYDPVLKRRLMKIWMMQRL
ncbi:GNAT family N-acetyltransferase [Cohaesibacter marisflavi]|nr:GNAT family N-acetyltransferase [Cohaesibacter marisflavi]